MSHDTKLTFVAQDDAFHPVVVVFAGKEGALAEAAKARLGDTVAARIKAAASAETFSGKAGAALALPAEAGLGDALVHLLVMGVETKDEAPNFLNLGGQVQGKLPKGRDASVLAILPAGAMTPEQAADFALGTQLAAYKFDRYQTKKGDDAEKPTGKLALHVGNPSAARKAWKSSDAVLAGVLMARDLVNEPANVLTPTEFAARASELESLGVEIEVLGEKDMKKLGMRALLGVGQGSHEDSKLVIMKWLGAKDEKAPPIAFIGKGVVFDTGGISIKPAAGMEDMKGDMGGAAAVVGLMKALAGRKAKANVIGAIGLVENMPDGKAIRPGDILTSMSGQTIEVINTDAEGRLVLCDVLWHIKHKFDPSLMVSVATLTGGIIVALGHERAGYFTKSEKASDALMIAGEKSGEKVWRLPLDDSYNRLIKSLVADMKNAGGREAQPIMAAKFLEQFVDGANWVHIDICGVAFNRLYSPLNPSWATGYGVRLFDKWVDETWLE